MKSKLLRLLTFVCFFQFSGINNGYTLLTTAISPVDAGQSAATVTRALNHLHPSVSSDLGISFIRSSHGFIVEITQASETLIRDFFSRVPAGGLMRLSRSGEFESGYRGLFETRQFSAWNKKEEYIRSGDGFAPDLGSLSRLTGASLRWVDSAASTAPRTRSGFEARFDLAWKRILTRRTGSALNGDASQIYITRSRI